MLYVDADAFAELHRAMDAALSRCRDSKGLLVTPSRHNNVNDVLLGAMATVFGHPVVEQGLVMLCRMDDEWTAAWPPQPGDRPAHLGSSGKKES